MKREIKAMKGKKTEWTPEMIAILQAKFPTEFTFEIAQELGLSKRTIVRKARELGVLKIEGFLETKRAEITEMARKNLRPHPHKGDSSYRIPNGEAHRFKKGRPQPVVDYEQIHNKRNETIRKEKQRIKYGLPQKTKLKLVNIYS